MPANIHHQLQRWISIFGGFASRTSLVIHVCGLSGNQDNNSTKLKRKGDYVFINISLLLCLNLTMKRMTYACRAMHVAAVRAPQREQQDGNTNQKQKQVVHEFFSIFAINYCRLCHLNMPWGMYQIGHYLAAQFIQIDEEFVELSQFWINNWPRGEILISPYPFDSINAGQWQRTARIQYRCGPIGDVNSHAH